MNLLKSNIKIEYWILFLIAVFYFFTILDGQGWGDDFALYLLHTKNICSGNSYSDTGFIFNPYALSYSPSSYPPGFPFLIAPLYAFFQLELTPYKIFFTILFFISLFIFIKIIENKLEKKFLLVLLIALGLSPYFWQLRNNILADIPSLFGIFLVIFLENNRSQQNNKLTSILIGLLTFLAVSMRTTGLALLPALLYNFIIVNKRKDKNFIYICIFFILPFLLQSWLLKQDHGYLEMMHLRFDGFSLNKMIELSLFQTNQYIADFNALSQIGTKNISLNVLFTTFCFILFITGWYLHAKRNFNFIDIFLFALIGIIFIWPFYQGIRYLIPLLPFYYFYIVYSIQSLEIKWFKQFVLAIYFLIISILYIGFYSTTSYEEIPYGIDYIDNQEVFQFITSSTSKESILMSTKPRAFTLYTERKGIVFPDGGNWSKFYDLIYQYHVTHIIVGSIDYSDLPKTATESAPDIFKKVYQNNSFIVYQILK